MDVMVGRIDTLVKLVGCVKCGEQNIREDNNHIICWNCRIHFCFLCNKKLSPPYTRHFTKTKCKQYGDITS
jgi:E3 ubiquitin-protein ligase RNF14